MDEIVIIKPTVENMKEVVDITDEETKTKTNPKTKTNAVESLLNHEWTKQLKYDGVSFVWNREGDQPIRMKGITMLTKSRFYPYYSPIRNKKGVSSKQTGTRVHRQIYHMIECVKKRKGECICVGVKTSANRLHRWTQQALDQFSTLEIEPDACEIPIMCLHANKCTAIDVIGTMCRGKPSEKSVHISIKTGYQKDYDTNSQSSRMREPLGKVLSSPQNHNLLQLLIEKMILEKEYQIIFDEYIIIYLGHYDFDKPRVEYLKESIWCKNTEISSRVYDEFCKYAADKK